MSIRLQSGGLPMKACWRGLFVLLFVLVFAGITAERTRLPGHPGAVKRRRYTVKPRRLLHAVLLGTVLLGLLSLSMASVVWATVPAGYSFSRSEEHTSELQS